MESPLHQFICLLKPSEFPRENAMAAASSNNTIALDVVVDIMARLPVKSLVRLRLISKFFFSITAASNFITSHLALSRSSRYAALSSRYANPPISIAILDKSLFEVLRQEIPFSSSVSDTKHGVHKYLFVGSCHGLLCYADSNNWGGFGDIIFLWNPMIKKFKSIRDTSLNSDMLRDPTTINTLGFTYDGKNDDYKIIRIVITKHKNEPSHQAEIYSLRTNSWRKVISPCNSLGEILKFESLRCAIVHGALHWVACLSIEANPPYGLVILSFIIDDEQFKVIRLPENHLRGQEIFSIGVMALKGSLAVPILYQLGEDEQMQDEEMENEELELEDVCKVWKMDMDEEDERWTTEMIPFSVLWCHGCTEEGEILVSQNNCQMYLYNLETRTLGKTMAYASYVVPFRGSLVLL